MGIFERTRLNRMVIMRRHFTLIELLIVIAIIAILAAMLLPVLEKGRQLAHESVCKSNQKQLSACFGMYFSDFNDYFVPACHQVAGWAPMWYDNFSKQGYMPPTVISKNNIIQSRGKMWCPTTAEYEDIKNMAGKAASAYLGYYSYSYFMTSGLDPSKTMIGGNIHKKNFLLTRAKIPKPSRTAMLVETGAGTSFPKAVRGDGSYMKWGVWVHPEKKGIGGCNALWVDGHVEKYIPDRNIIFNAPDWVWHAYTASSLNLFPVNY